MQITTCLIIIALCAVASADFVNIRGKLFNSTQQEAEYQKRLFEIADKNKDSLISRDEFGILVNRTTKEIRAQNLTVDGLDFDDIDADGKLTVNADERR